MMTFAPASTAYTCTLLLQLVPVGTVNFSVYHNADTKDTSFWIC